MHTARYNTTTKSTVYLLLSKHSELIPLLITFNFPPNLQHERDRSGSFTEQNYIYILFSRRSQRGRGRLSSSGH